MPGTPVATLYASIGEVVPLLALALMLWVIVRLARAALAARHDLAVQPHKQ